MGVSPWAVRLARWCLTYTCVMLAWGLCERGFRRGVLLRVGNGVRRASGRRPLPAHAAGAHAWGEDGVSVRGMLAAVILGVACVGPSSRIAHGGVRGAFMPLFGMGWGGQGNAYIAHQQLSVELEAVASAVAAYGSSLSETERRVLAEEVAKVVGVSGWGARDELEGVLPCRDSAELDSIAGGGAGGADPENPGTNPCEAWAAVGECENNPEYMSTRCRRSCGVCGTAQEWDRVASGLSSRPQHTAVPPEVHVVSWKPRIFYLPGFLSGAEADRLQELSQARGLERSTVVGDESGGNDRRDSVSEVRTSTGVFLSSSEDPLLKALDGRLARYSRLPPENGEAMQVLHYDPGQLYRPHLDAFDEQAMQGSNGRGGQRAATVLMYLGDVEEGGETHFPEAVPLGDAGEVDPDTGRPLRAPGHPNTCGGVEQHTGLAVHPKKGDAVLFYTVKEDGTVDSRSMHAGCAVVKGEKWTATKWIRTSTFS